MKKIAEQDKKLAEQEKKLTEQTEQINCLQKENILAKNLSKSQSQKIESLNHKINMLMDNKEELKVFI